MSKDMTLNLTHRSGGGGQGESSSGPLLCQRQVCVDAEGAEELAFIYTIKASKVLAKGRLLKRRLRLLLKRLEPRLLERI